MSSPLVTVKSIDSIDTAAETIAENKVKRLVVLEQDGSMVGILSISDIARKLAKILTEDYSRISIASKPTGCRLMIPFCVML